MGLPVEAPTTGPLVESTFCVCPGCSKDIVTILLTNPLNELVSPPGDFSNVVRHEDGYITRTMKNGAQKLLFFDMFWGPIFHSAYK